ARHSDRLLGVDGNPLAVIPRRGVLLEEVEHESRRRPKTLDGFPAKDQTSDRGQRDPDQAPPARPGSEEFIGHRLFLALHPTIAYACHAVCCPAAERTGEYRHANAPRTSAPPTNV